jgi:hypothetical protein
VDPVSDNVAQRSFPGFPVSAGYFASARFEGSFAKTGGFRSSIALFVPNIYVYDDISSDTFH